MGSAAQTYIHILWRGGLDEYREKRREREERSGKREVYSRPQDNEREGESGGNKIERGEDGKRVKVMAR